MDVANDHAELLSRAISGDQSAVETLLVRHHAVLASHLESRIPASLRGELSVDDLLQETFIQVFRDIGRFDPTSDRAFAAWLKVLAENRLLDAIKSAGRRKRGGDWTRAASASSGEDGSYVALVDLLSGDGRSPSQSAGRRDAARVLRIAIAGLPEEYREAVRLRHLEGVEVEEIARRMSRTPGAIRGLLDRAKERLREALGRASQYF